MATQDRILQAKLRNVPGRCLLYLHETTTILESPSEASKKWVKQQAKKTLLNGCENIELLKQKQGLKTTTNDGKHSNAVSKRPKNPNPLSCKKSKKAPISNQITKSSDKPKRKRIRLAPHIKKILEESK